MALLEAQSRRGTSHGADADTLRFLPACFLFSRYTQGEMTSQNIRSRYGRHFVGTTWHNAWS